jgi:bla regulator protein blaR1
MIRDERRKTRLMAFSLSLGIHVAALLAFSLSGPDGAYVVVRPSSAASTSETAQPPRSSRRPRPAPRRTLPAQRSRVVTTRTSPSSPAAPASGFRALQQMAVQQLDTGSETELAKWLNHLWQSTLFVLAAALLTLAFQRNRARVRYWLWFSASMKFLVPLSVLLALGSRFPSAGSGSTSATGMSFTVAQFSQPFDGPATTGVPYTPPLEPSHWMGTVILAIWAIGVLAIVQARWRTWRNIRRIVAASTALHIPGLVLPRDVRLRSADTLLEPGVFGFWRPVVLLPSGIEQHLAPAQLHAVVMHELSHVKYRDNLTAAFHMVVEAIFWFHPVVWWIGAQLVRERERACDEEVLRVCGEPDNYANGIVNVCKQYVEPRIACVAGVSGSDLRKRIEAIMGNQPTEFLRWWKKALLMGSAAAAVVAPVMIGALTTLDLSAEAPAVSQARDAGASALAFETASIKPNKSGELAWRLDPQPGGIIAVNATTKALIRFAYDLSNFQLAGGPSWLDDDRFDVTAKAEGQPTLAQERAMLRRLLAERFRVVVRTETRTLPIYALVMARSDARLGPRLHRAQVDCAQSTDWGQTGPTGVGFALTNNFPSCGYFGFAPGTDLPAARGGLAFHGLTMAGVAKMLVPLVARNVTDRTGLTGYFDGEFDFALELPPPPPPPGVPNPWAREQFLSVFTVFPEQLGLKLDSRRGPVDVLVVDSAEHPTEN